MPNPFLSKQLVKWTITAAFSLCTIHVSSQQISVAGVWRFAIDKEDKGVVEKWFSTKLSEVITLPGSMAENLKGDDITLQTKWTGSIYDSSFYFNPRLEKYRQPTNLKFPFWLTPAKHYVGAAWYQKDVVIPARWKQRKILLYLERPHTETRVWIDYHEIGMQNTLVVAQEFELPALSPGKHTITLRIDNRIKEINVGINSHSISDHTQGNWNGVIGKMYLKKIAPRILEDIQLYPDVKNKQVLVKVRVKGKSKSASTLFLQVSSINTAAKQIMPSVTTQINSLNDTASAEIILPMTNNISLWDEFSPALYQLTAQLKTKNEVDTLQTQFGMREFKTAGTRFSVNGRPVFLRGTVNCAEFPLTGYSAMDLAAWKRIFNVAKAHGLNHMRFHSWCPPEAAFLAADNVGLYLQIEAPTWPNQGLTLGDGKPIDQFIYDETNRIAKAYGNHPSFCMLASGNEPGGKRQVAYLTNFIKYWQQKDKRRLYTGASVGNTGWPLVPANEFMVKSAPRGLHWDKVEPETLTDYSSIIEKFDVPYVTHEMGQWCVFPNFKEIEKYTGVYKARNFELFQQDLKDHFMADQANDFVMASGKLQTLCYKNEIEKTLRTKGSAGFQLLGLQDFPGQGTAQVGMLDVFWDDKPYINATEFSRFCNSTIPLSQIPKFTYTNTETFEATLELFHFGQADLKDAILQWIIKDNNSIIASGEFPKQTYRTGSCSPAGKISLPLGIISKATKLTLHVEVKDTAFKNDWEIWVYPSNVPTEKTTFYSCTLLDEKAEQILKAGGKVFLNAAGTVVKGKEVIMYFTPVFWNTSWFKMRPPHTTGMLIQNNHPSLENFPTEYYSNLQWWAIANQAQCMNLEDFPAGFKPIVQPIDTWFMNRRLALMMECKVGTGKLFVSSANLTDTVSQPSVRQLLHSIEHYLNSEKFDPQETVSLSIIKDIFQSPSKEVWKSFSKATPDELKPIQPK